MPALDKVEFLVVKPGTVIEDEKTHAPQLDVAGSVALASDPVPGVPIQSPEPVEAHQAGYGRYVLFIK